MPLSRLSSDKLVAYLSQLSPDVAAFLIREIELHRLDGRDDPLYEWIVSAAREVVRISDRTIDRVDTPLRLFCEPFGELLVDDTWGVERPGRISRKSIGPVWKWLLNGEQKDRLKTLSGQIETDIRRGGDEGVQTARRELIDCAAEAIEGAIAQTARSEKGRRRLEMVIGGADVLVDAVMMARAFRAYDAICGLRARLPATIPVLNAECRRDVAAALQEFSIAAPDSEDIAYAILIARLEVPAHALRLAVEDLGTDDSEEIAASGYALLGRILLSDTDIAAREVDRMVRDGPTSAAVVYALAAYHRHAEGMMLEIELDGRGKWAGALAAARRIASVTLDTEIRRAPELVAAVFKPYLGRMTGHPGGPPDQPTVDRAERALALSAGCRPFLQQLSLNEAVMQCDTQVHARLDAISEKILDELRAGDTAETARTEDWLGVLTGFVRIVHGEHEAGLLVRAARAARHGRGEGADAAKAAG